MFDCVNKLYNDLYCDEEILHSEMEEILASVEPKNLSEDIIYELEKDITECEIKTALFQMNKNKSPGIDGLTVEFFQTFWKLLNTDFLEECQQNGSLSNTMNTALIRLIYKNSGNKYELKNWRPISLLTIEYKIVSKAITNRLNKIMPCSIAEEQTCGVANRKIHDNLMILRDTIDYINWNNLEAAIVSIDQDKAFDRINWNYMFNIMRKMGIPNKLIEWVKLLYHNPTSHIILKIFIGSPLKISRGIRRGCTLSPLLLSICAEGLASLIRSNNNLNGIKTPDGQNSIKIIQHADDTTIFISKNSDFDNIKQILNTYCQGIGSKLNVNKTKGLWLGNWKHRGDRPCKFSWTNDKMKILGIVVGNNVTPEDNWGARSNKILCTLNKMV